jgi:hypothetical protein
MSPATEKRGDKKKHGSNLKSEFANRQTPQHSQKVLSQSTNRTSRMIASPDAASA